MLSGISNAISSCFFSVCQLCTPQSKGDVKKIQVSLDKADAIFQRFISINASEKQEMLNHLQEAYREWHIIYVENDEILSQDLQKMASRIFYLQARSLYGDMKTSRQMSELALAFQLMKAKKLQETEIPSLVDFDKLNQLPSILSTHDTFKTIKDSVMQLPEDEFSASIVSQGSGDAFLFATSLRWWSAACQNIDTIATSDNLPFFEKINGLAVKILEKINTPDSNWEIGQILYNTGRFIHYLKHPGDIEGAIKTLNSVLPYLAAEGQTLRAKVLQAQIHNVSAIEIYGKIPNKDDPANRQQFLMEWYDLIAKASDIAQSTPHFDRFLKAMFINNRISAAVVLAQEGIDVAPVADIDAWIKIVLEEMEKDNYSHFYHGVFALNAARFELLKGNIDQGLKLLDLASEINKKFPESTAKIQEKVEFLKRQLQPAS